MPGSNTDGVSIRLARLMDPDSDRCVIVTLDATLFSGPEGSLAAPASFANAIAAEKPDALLAFPGLLAAVSPEPRIGRIVNGTASTTLNDGAEKVPTATPHSVSRQGGDAVGLHLNLGHPRSPMMLKQTALAIAEFDAAGIPVLVASYVPGADPVREWRKVAHAARVASDLGASVVKTSYTGNSETFSQVVEAALPARVVAAGGPLESAFAGLTAASGAIRSGASGVAYGRTIFEAGNPVAVLRALKAVVHESAEPSAAMEANGLASDVAVPSPK
jgi:DhnA family fructose-bisphosphate aldolase class Ia